MSAQEAQAQVDQMLDELNYATMTLNEIQQKLESLQGGAILLGLTASNNASVAGVVQIIDAAINNRETLERFLFHIRTRLDVYKQALG